MSPFGFRSFNRNWINSRYSFATKTLIGCEHGRVTNDMISCIKRGKMAARILAVRFSLCPHIPAKKNISSFGDTLQDVFQTYHPPLAPDNYVQTAHNSSLRRDFSRSVCPSVGCFWHQHGGVSLSVSVLFIWQAKQSGLFAALHCDTSTCGSADQSKTTLFEVRLRSI